MSLLLAVLAATGSGCQSTGSLLGGREAEDAGETGGIFGTALFPPADPSPDKRVRLFDRASEELNVELAQAKQQMSVLSEESRMLREQLASTVVRLRRAESEANNRVAQAGAPPPGEAAAGEPRDAGGVGRLASSTRPLGATLVPNDGIREKAATLDLPGVETRADGDLIRLTIPSDQLFAAAQSRLQPSATPLLDSVAAVIRREFPRQIVGIEAHLDKDVAGSASVVQHQVTAAQALAVLNYFTERSQLSEQQFFLLAQGDNRPLASNATLAGRSRNRRIEIVLYPETY